MKKVFYGICLLSIFFFIVTPLRSFAQEDAPVVRNANDDPEDPVSNKGFRKENIFAGGNIQFAGGSGYLVMGVNPLIGVKLNDYVDVGAVLNYTYVTQRDNIEYNDKYKKHIIGPGIFTRLYPVSFLFLQAQAEQNFTNRRYIAAPHSTAFATKKDWVSAPSLLLGGGYAGGRAKGGTNFYYMSILVDVLQKANSPYVNTDYNADGTVRRIVMQPVFRVGYNIGLFQRRYNGY